MANPRDQYSILYKQPVQETKQNTKPVNRLRAGQKPEWMKEESDSDDDIFREATEKLEINNIQSNKREVNRENIKEIEKADRRLQRLTRDRKEDGNKDKLEERLKLRREINRSKIVSSNDNDKNVNINSVKEIKSTREEIKQKLLENLNKEEPQEADDELLELLGENDDVKEDNQAALYEEIEEDDEEEQEEAMMRPVFVRKDDRKTINEQLQYEVEEQMIKEQQVKQKEIRKQETKQLVKKIVEKEEMEALEDKNTEDTEMPDDTDNIDDLEEYEKWKLRELRRIKQQVEEDERRLNDKSELERRRNLTDEQRKEENLRLGSDDTLRSFKSKINFLQKYYHKGAFYQADAKTNMEHIYNRDYNLPTWEDKIDRSAMPLIKQKRRGREFKKGQTKYTHLTQEDTTNFDPTYKMPENINKKLVSNLGGYKGENTFDLTKKKRK